MSALRTFLLLPILFLAGWAGAAAQEIKVTNQDADGATIIKVENPFPCPIVFSIDATLKNLAPSKPLPLTVNIPAGATQEVCRFNVVEKGEATKWNHQWKYRLGSVDTKHDDTVVYALPYPKGKSYPVMQGFLGEFSHTGEFSYSIDWKMPLGSQVCAAREGRVVRIKSQFEKGAPREEFRDKANYVILLHADGTLGEYQHLQKDGILVKIGQQVKVGEVIASSGTSGYSSGPHLHFHVCVPVDAKTFRTLPIKFRTAAGAAVLKEGESYTAP